MDKVIETPGTAGPPCDPNLGLNRRRLPARMLRRVGVGFGVGVAVVGGCALVFMAWRNPHLAVELATVVKACF